MITEKMTRDQMFRAAQKAVKAGKKVKATFTHAGQFCYETATREIKFINPISRNIYVRPYRGWPNKALHTSEISGITIEETIHG